MQWTAEVDAKMVMHILRIHQVKLDYNAIASAMGNDCTAKAIMHRVAKLKELAASADNGSSTPVSTGAKRGRRPKAATTPNNAKNTDADSSVTNNVATPTPAAKKRTAGGQKKNGTAVTNKDSTNDKDASAHEEEGGNNAAQPVSKKVKTEAPKVTTAKPGPNGDMTARMNHTQNMAARLMAITDEEIQNGVFSDGTPIPYLHDSIPLGI